MSRPPRTTTAPRLRRWGALVLAASLPLGVAGCRDHEDGPTTNEIAAPPNQESPQLALGDDVELPSWGYSATCDQPRPVADSAGLVEPDPLAGDRRVQFYAPAVEDVLCNLSGVQSASAAGQYDEVDGIRTGAMDIGVVMDSETSEENMRAVRQAAITAATEQGLPAQGLGVDGITIILTDGSSVKGPAEGLTAGGAETLTVEGIHVLDQLRQTDSGSRWSVEVGEEFTLSTYLDADVTAAGFPDDVAAAMAESTKIQATTEPVVRQDRVVVTDDGLTLTYAPGQQDDLSDEVLEDLAELSRTDDVKEVSASITTDKQGRPVLKVRTRSATPAKVPDTDARVGDLETSLGELGLQLDHKVLGAPAPLDS